MSGSNGGESRGSGASTPGEHRPGEDLATVLSDVAQSLQQEPDVQATLQGIVDAAQDAVPGAEHVSLSSIVRRREVKTRAATDELPLKVDRAQMETGQGPCLDTLYEQRTARIPEMAVEERWPDFVARATDCGVSSMLSLQLFVRGDDLGVLNLFSSRPNAFGEESEHVGLLFASHAAIAMSEAQEKEQLRSAIEFRDLIGQAKGILMERYKIDSDRAFQVLTRASQTRNRKLREIAAELVTRGTLDHPTGSGEQVPRP